MKNKLFKDLLLSIKQMGEEIMKKKKCKKKCKDCKCKASIPYKNIQKAFKEEDKWRKTHPFLTKLKDIWWWIRYGIVNKIKSIPLEIRSFIQRGNRGWSNRDVWGLDYYLAKTIEKSIICLKENKNGFPNDLTEGKWIDILNTISDTFYFAKECSKGDLYLIRDIKKRKKWQKSLDETDKEINYNSYIRCMNNAEIKTYDLGWKNFRKYFFNLWD